MKIRYYHKKKAVKSAIKAIGMRTFLAKRRKARVLQAKNCKANFENRLRRLGVC